MGFEPFRGLADVNTWLVGALEEGGIRSHEQTGKTFLLPQKQMCRPTVVDAQTRIDRLLSSSPPEPHSGEMLTSLSKSGLTDDD